MGVPGLALLTCAPLFPARLCWKHVSSLHVANEPVLAFTRGSPERDALQKVMGDREGHQECLEGLRGGGLSSSHENSLYPLLPLPPALGQPGIWTEPGTGDGGTWKWQRGHLGLFGVLGQRS